jgi:hypothetical protein
MYEKKHWDSAVTVRREHTASYEDRTTALEFKFNIRELKRGKVRSG